MVYRVHVILHSEDATADRAFFREILGFSTLDAGDAGDGWLIFAVPPPEGAVHPPQSNAQHELNFMSADLAAEISAVGAKGVGFSEVQVAQRGSVTMIRPSGGGEVGRCQPKHPPALALTPDRLTTH